MRSKVTKKTTNKKTQTKKKQTTAKTRTEVAERKSTDRRAGKKIQTVRGVYQDVIQSEEAVDALKHAGFEETHVSLLPVAVPRTAEIATLPARTTELHTEVSDAGSAIARLAGGALAVGSMALAAPVLLMLPALGSLAVGMSALTGGGSSIRKMDNTIPASDSRKGPSWRWRCQQERRPNSAEHRSTKYRPFDFG